MIVGGLLDADYNVHEDILKNAAGILNNDRSVLMPLEWRRRQNVKVDETLRRYIYFYGPEELRG